MVLLALGLCVIVFWIIRRIAHPRKLLLVQSPGRANTIHPLHVFGVFLAWLLAGRAAYEILIQHAALETIRARMVAGPLGQAVWIGAALLVAATTFRNGLIRGMGLSLRHWPWDAVRTVVGYLVVFPICLGLADLTRRLMPADWVHPHPALTAMRELGPAWHVLIVVSVIGLAPLAEELFFRGLVQSMLRRYTGRPWAALIGTSACFASVHVATPHHVPALFALGIALGYNYERTGRLIAPIGIHTLFNAVTIIAWYTQVQ
ncbi:MAG: CPBP family intramembrane metalloprotease [Phycisphaerae bacterium]|nr:CPBP family intramembrane metalloprotease [Phycisphaerae bacterium]